MCSMAQPMYDISLGWERLYKELLVTGYPEFTTIGKAVRTASPGSAATIRQFMSRCRRNVRRFSPNCFIPLPLRLLRDNG